MKVEELLLEITIPQADAFWVNVYTHKYVECDDLAHADCIAAQPHTFGLQDLVHGQDTSWLNSMDASFSKLKKAAHQKGWVRCYAVNEEVQCTGFTEHVKLLGKMVFALVKFTDASTIFLELYDGKHYHDIEWHLPEDRMEAIRWFNS